MKTTCVVSNPSTKTDSVVMLWHYRLGHPALNNMVQTQFQAKIQVLRTDNAREYYHNILGSYLLENGIVHQSSCIDTPQKNGVAERKNRHLMEVARPNSQLDNTIYDLNSSNDLDDLDQPIALRKGVRSCTQHPISNHVSYGKLTEFPSVHHFS